MNIMMYRVLIETSVVFLEFIFCSFPYQITVLIGNYILPCADAFVNLDFAMTKITFLLFDF